MVFDSFIAAHWTMLGTVFAIAVVLGAVVNKSNFCTMGAVSDIVNMQDWQRMRMWILIIAVAILGVGLLEPLGLINADESMPPYRSADFAWAGYLVGGLLFGIGMTLGSGCGNKTVVRIGAGNLKSLFVAAILGTVAFFMVNPLPLVDASLRDLLFGWVQATALSHSHGQDLGSLIAGEAGHWVRPLLALFIGGALLYAVLRVTGFRRDRNAVSGALIIGACIVAVWTVTSNVYVADEMGQRDTLQTYATDWDFHHPDTDTGRPESTRWLAPQGVNFVGPLVQSTEYTASGFDPALVTVGVMVIGGVILGSFLWALISRSFRFEWFADRQDFNRHLSGGVLMGIGGPLAMGCTFGQGITGMSTLALSAPLALGGLILGSALTMKVQYYKLLYEDEATFGKALVTGLVDLRLLPASLRQLDAL
ncbi:MAG: YeeE/YedE family protein [Halorhodospira halophila]|uniref:YeeE/YedE family protein n=1 Tax=Halorhodospira TaxID=85108 RepID=UPI001EE7FB00|nr:MULTISPECIES: YeeE/YedE family protein [Halorhodospira]MCC3750069.1 YeeE/YedE family protein [Halorhodospira halophila]MCG5527601.1 YeeE/YedE family protein [Halorhodospira halophila]MCG5532620.1 YeeE/YedE family protein [Halorhodospira sp. 9621]MCG5537645.1 YeeE/YedE family protein [Halorhodospira sp. 9622]MCG5540005.1 YeeE/YedE family protein [Halorhodospira sp. M39old]